MSEQVGSSLNDVQNQFKLKVGHRPHSMQQLLSFCNHNNIGWKFKDIKKWWPTRPEPEEKPQEAPVNADDYKLDKKHFASDNDDNNNNNNNNNNNKEESENKEPIKTEDSKTNDEAVIIDKESSSYSLTLSDHSDDESINITNIEHKDTVHDIEKDKNEKKIIPKKALSDILNFNGLYRIQQFLYFITYPLVWFVDISWISNREWIQLPLLTYLISITRLIIAQTWVTLCVESIIQYIDIATFYLLSYTFGMFIICLLLLYYFKDYTTKYHYNYFMELSTHMTGYGLLYFCVHIQYLWFSDKLQNSWLFFIYSSIILCVVIIVIVFVKQFIFKVSMDNKILNEYLKYLKLYSRNNDDDETLSLMDNTDIDIDFEMFKEEEIEMNSFWFTVLFILQNMWSIALGLVLIECFVFIFVGYYVNLLVSWEKWQKTSIEHNLWEIIVFGFILAIFTAFIQGIIELSCKKSCYSYVYNVDDSKKQNSVYKLMIFILNVLSDIESVWIEILSAGIGWALLTPNQAKTVWSQLEISVVGTIGFVLFGLLSQKYNHKKQKDIFNEIQSVKNDANIDNKEKILMKKTKKLILFEQMILIYNAAFAVSISNAWESFASLALYATYYRHLNPVGLFMVHLVYAVCITLIFIQLGLQLCDIKKQRLYEAINSLDATQ